MIHREARESTAVLTLEHGKVQALDLELLDELELRLAELEQDGTRAVVLTGTGAAFSAGVDLFRLLDAGADYRARFLTALDACLWRLFCSPLPVVAAVNGHAIAGGCIVAAACDHRIATDANAKIGVTELLVGVPFPPVALAIMRSLLAPHALARLVYGGATLSPQAALAHGLVDEIAPAAELRERALERARQLAAIPRTTFAVTKRQLRAPIVDALQRDRDRFDAAVRDAWEAPATHAAVRAFLDRTVRRGR